MLEVRFHLEAHLWFGPDSSTSSHGVGEWKAEQMQPNVAVVVAPNQAAGFRTPPARRLPAQPEPHHPPARNPAHPPPADARLLEARDLHIQQAALTGESLPSEKTGPAAVETSPTDPDAPDRVFLGPSVVSGTATALVTATGPRTAFGGIVTRLAARPPETEFQRGLRRFGVLNLQTVFFLVLFVSFVGIVGHHDAFESLLFAVALAVGLTPEFLPMITTVTLGQGAVHM